MMTRLLRAPYQLSIALALLLTACDKPVPPPIPPAPAATMSEARPGDVRDAGSMKQRQIAFLNRLREADPQQKTIDRAMLNEQNELGLILDRSVDMAKIPVLMRSMLTEMAKEFPGEDLTVLAYTPSVPPHKIGTGRLNAQTRDMSYTPEP